MSVELLTPLRKKMLVVSILSASFLFLLNQFLLITAFPQIMEDFSVNATQVQWLTTAFLLTTTILIPTMGYFMGRFHARSLTFVAISFFIVGTILAIFAQTFSLLIVARVVQAVGAGMMLPLVQTVLLLVYPIEKRGYAMGLMTMVVNVAPAIGPSIAGYIVDLSSWRFLFWLVLPLAVLLLVLNVIFMRNITEKANATLSVPSLIFSAIGFAGIILAISNFSVYGISLYVIIPAVIGVMSLSFFIWSQLTSERPMLNLRLFRLKWFVHGTVLSFLISVLLLSTETLLPLFIQDVQERSAFISGMTLLPGTLLLSVTSFLAGRWFDRYGGKILGIIGYSIMGLTFVWFTFMGAETSVATMIICFSLFMGAVGIVMTPATAIAMNALKQKDLPHGTAILNTVKQFAAALGVTVLTTLVSLSAARPEYGYAEGTLIGLSLAFATMGVLSFIALMLAIFTRNRSKSSNTFM
ncbi:DHA2 family efflux MFS transporter permease subunit [Bacillus sp. Marseille-P3800]|uniref:DHA2 family efflux MFS transporter permease subunit n=1 Tax=Bacillus sp. Marseille-P3800 TaxID=2014782 RepID=UPI000C06976B|nr:DHA2 family efflux MFS transporter permease subunit [Bacillus sp. Marseille-P3800]